MYLTLTASAHVPLKFVCMCLLIAVNTMLPSMVNAMPDLINAAAGMQQNMQENVNAHAETKRRSV